MISRIFETRNYCGHDIKKPVRVTTNILGRRWVEPVGWHPRQEAWLKLPKTPNTYLGREKK